MNILVTKNDYVTVYENGRWEQKDFDNFYEHKESYWKVDS